MYIMVWQCSSVRPYVHPSVTYNVRFFGNYEGYWFETLHMCLWWKKPLSGTPGTINLKLHTCLLGGWKYLLNGKVVRYITALSVSLSVTFNVHFLRNYGGLLTWNLTNVFFGVIKSRGPSFITLDINFSKTISLADKIFQMLFLLYWSKIKSISNLLLKQ